MTLILPNSNPTSNHNINTPPKSQKSSPIYVWIHQGMIKGRIQSHQEKTWIPPPVFHLHPPLPYRKAFSPPPLHNNHSSTSTSAPCLLPAVIVLHLCCRSFVDYFFVIVVSTIVTPPPPTVVTCPLLHPLCLFSRHLPVILHIILPSLLVCLCACCALVDCFLPLMVVPSLSLHHHSCLSIVICHAVCRGAALIYKKRKCRLSDFLSRCFF